MKSLGSLEISTSSSVSFKIHTFIKKEHERQAYKVSAEDTKDNNRKYIDELAKENKELKKFKEDIVANRKAAYTAGMAKIPGATYF